MKVSSKAWDKYIKTLSAVDAKSASLMEKFIQKNGTEDSEWLIEYAYGLSTKYGEAAAAAACEMYDATAIAQKVSVPPAVPAPTASYGEVAKAVNGTKDVSDKLVPQAVSRLVKRAGADTTLKNAERDGAQFAWIPSGDACPFCIMLASRGWQYMSKNAMKNGHAEHIHANCNCEYAIRFDKESSVSGYNPDKYKKMYYGADGNTPKERINAMRREQYALSKEESQPAAKSEAFERMEQIVASNKVDYLPVDSFSTQPSDDEIIERLGGGDLTGGSCTSLALAYAGNKYGYDVLDFRGGVSEKVFSRTSNIANIIEMAQGYSIKAGNDINAAVELLKKAEEGHEYFLATGQHAAIIRLINGKYEYLELQSPTGNGWHPFTKDILRSRFGCKRSHTIYGSKVEALNTMFDIKNIKGNEEFRQILGYINTSPGKQKKGVRGSAK